MPQQQPQKPRQTTQRQRRPTDHIIPFFDETEAKKLDPTVSVREELRHILAGNWSADIPGIKTKAQRIRERPPVVSFPRPPEGFPDIPPPGPRHFARTPTVMGSPLLHRLVEMVLREAPELRNTVRSVSETPGKTGFDMIEKSGFQPQEYPKLNLLGTYDRDPAHVYISPINEQFDPELAAATVGHEFGHAAGMSDIMDNRALNNVEGLMRMLWIARSKNPRVWR